MDAMHSSERGQSLVEIALTLPIILLVLVGLADVGRIYYYATAVSSAAHEGALYAARNPAAVDVATRACGEMGFSACPTAIEVSYTRGPDSGCLGYDDVCLSVTYRIELISGVLAARFFPINPVPVSGYAVVPGLASAR